MVLGTVGSRCCCYHHDQITSFLNVLCLKSSLLNPSSTLCQNHLPQMWVWSPPFPLTTLQGPLLPSVSVKFLIWASGAPASDALFLAMPSGILNSGCREQLAVPPLRLLWFLLGFGTQFLFPLPHLPGLASLLSFPVQPWCHLHALPPLSALLCIPGLTSMMASISGIYNHQFDCFLLHAARFLKEGFICIWNLQSSPKLSHTLWHI